LPDRPQGQVSLRSATFFGVYPLLPYLAETGVLCQRAIRRASLWCACHTPGCLL